MTARARSRKRAQRTQRALAWWLRSRGTDHRKDRSSALRSDLRRINFVFSRPSRPCDRASSARRSVHASKCPHYFHMIARPMFPLFRGENTVGSVGRAATPHAVKSGSTLEITYGPTVLFHFRCSGRIVPDAKSYRQESRPIAATQSAFPHHLDSPNSFPQGWTAV